MKIFRIGQTVVTSLALLLAFEAFPKLQVTLLTTQPVFAQSETPTSETPTSETPTSATPASSTSTFSLPESVTEGTKITVDGSSSMETINEALKQKFEGQYSGTEVTLSANGTDAALQALRDSQVDLAAIGRPLTDEEKAEGFVEVPISRHKIAILVAPDSPFDGNLTIDQFAQIFRGEVDNWEQVGGPSAPVKLVDRPETSDTRRAFAGYPVFQVAPFEAGPNATQVEDDTKAVIEALGADGVGYAIADQVQNQPGVRIIQMHLTLPDDPRYPFSQPLAYVYKGPEPSDNVKAYLGYATTPENERVIAEARTQTASPTPVATATPTVEATETSTPVETAPADTRTSTTVTTESERRGGFPWWILLLPLLGLPFLFMRRGQVAPVAAPPPVAPPPPPVRPGRIILTPRNCRNAYAYWELSDADEAALRRSENRPALKLYDVTGIDINNQQPHSVKQFECDAFAQDMHLPIALDDRDYLVELGYTTEDGRWVKTARSEHVRVPKCTPLDDAVKSSVGTTIGTVAATATAATAATAATLGIAQSRPQVETTTPYPPVRPTDEDRLILVARDFSDVYAYWEISEAEKAVLRDQGGRDLKLRLYDVTGIDINQEQPHSVREFDCSEIDSDRHMPVYESGRDYLVELGYITDDGRWLRVARSPHVHVPAAPETSTERKTRDRV
ncbi:MAG: DUF4912 domain-containing protein [Microcoleaceae cyanobacterium]